MAKEKFPKAAFKLKQIAAVKVKIINAAQNWRALDESEPIPSKIVNNALKDLAFLVDELKHLQAGKV